MKKCNVFFVFIVALGFCTSATGQTGFGIRAGVNVSTFENNAFLLQISTESLAKTSFTFSPDLSTFINFSLSDKLSIQPEIHYLLKGGRIKEAVFLSANGGTVVQQTLETKYQVSFVEIPVVLKYKLISTELAPAIILGGSYGRAIAQKWKGEPVYILRENNTPIAVSGEGNRLDWNTDLGDEGKFNQNDWSGVIGISIEKTLNKQLLVFDIRYLHDLTDWRTAKINDNSKAQIRNRNMAISTGIIF